jgi:hypothetical protein
MSCKWIGQKNLLATVLATGTFFFYSTSSHAKPPDHGCQADRRTVQHSDGVVLAEGTYIPCLIDTGFKSGESGLAITRDGTLLRSVTLFPTGIAVSSDSGATWKLQVLPKNAPAFIADGYVDPATDRYFYAGAFSKPVFSSDDKGITWSQSTFGPGRRDDWPKLFSGPPATPRSGGYPTNIYYCNWTLPLGIFSQTRCFKSIDGGAAFTATGSDPYANAICKDSAQTTGVGHGRGIVDPHDGTIYLPASYCGSMEVAISRDEGASWQRKTIRKNASNAEKKLSDAKHSAQWREQLDNYSFNLVPAELAAGQNSDSLAIDGNGRLYALWIDGDSYLPVIAYSSDGGAQWSEPVVVSPPDVVQAVLPSIAIASDGRLGISYYGTRDKWSWTGYMAISNDAAVSKPIFETATVTYPTQPLLSEPCCWASGPQEYTAARWAPDGSLWAAFAGHTGVFFYARGVVGRLVSQ